jgi:hypothetical protein
LQKPYTIPIEKKKSHTPFDNLKSCAKARWETITDWMIKVIPKYKVIPIDIFLQPEAEADAVGVFILRMRR